MNTFFLLDAPYSGADIFLHHYENQSDGAIKRFRDNLDIQSDNGQRAVTTVSPSALRNLKHDTPLKSVGIMLCDPATRLARAYLVLLQQGHTRESFQEYYSNPKRANLFHRILANKPLNKLGFVGVHERFNSSLHLASTWLSLNRRLGHHHGLRNEHIDTSDLLTDLHQVNIKKIHAEDYALYKEASQLVNTRLNQLYPNQSASLSTQKKIIIHVGPPKTGTSAIQSWLLENKKHLKKAGIYYPKHQKDENEISSGNFLSLLTKNEETNKYDIDLQKLSSLLQQFEQMKCHTLLLSSEHFHNHLISLFCYLPNAQYVFYVRHPLSIIESSYHQQVKRHRRTSLLKVPANITFNHLMAFLNVSQELATRPIIRFYDKELLEGHSLVADFINLLNLTHIKVDQDKRINPRFGFGELELMRVCNHFLNENTASKLDRWLQKQSHHKSSFTLIQSKDIENSKQQLSKQLSRIFAAYSDLLHSKALNNKLEQLTNLSIQLPYKDQFQCSDDVLATWETLKSDNIMLAHEIISQHRNYHKHPTSENDVVSLIWGWKDRFRRVKAMGDVLFKKRLTKT